MLLLREFPNVGFNISHNGLAFLPVNAFVELKHILGGKDLGIMDDKTGYNWGKLSGILILPQNSTVISVYLKRILKAKKT